MRVCLESNVNRLGWHEKAYLRVVEEARHITDQAERIKRYQEANRLLIEEALVLPISYDMIHRLVKPWVKNFPVPNSSASFPSRLNSGCSFLVRSYSHTRIADIESKERCLLAASKVVNSGFNRGTACSPTLLLNLIINLFANNLV